MDNRRVNAKRAVLGLQQVSKTLQSKRQVPKSCFGTIAEASDKEHNLDGKPVKRKIFYLRSSGCAWALKANGGCTMCGHYVGTAKGNKVSAANYITQFRNEFQKYDYGEFPVVAVYNAGSFLGNEIPIEAQIEIMEIIGAEPKIEMVIFESRPEFITDEALALIREQLGDRRVQIGIGFETVDDEIRELSINKGAMLGDYDKAFEKMRRYNIEILTYILMKPAFISEVTAIDDTVRSIEYAFSAGATSVSIEPVSVQDDTVIDLLHRAGVYRTPWIWSVFEVLKATHHRGDVRAGGFEFFPAPREFVHNCPRCDGVCYKALREYNETYSVDAFDAINCDCREEWRTDTLTQHPFIAAWRTTYQSFGVKAKRHQPTAEAMIRRVLKGETIPTINPVVDIYLTVEVERFLPIGGYDSDQIAGDITLRFSPGGEEFTPIGGGEEVTNAGEVVYSDEKKILTRRWNYRDCEFSKITQESSNIILMIEAASDKIETAALAEATELLTERLKQFFDGDISHSILSVSSTTMMIIEGI